MSTVLITAGLNIRLRSAFNSSGIQIGSFKAMLPPLGLIQYTFCVSVVVGSMEHWYFITEVQGAAVYEVYYFVLYAIYLFRKLWPLSPLTQPV
jgi:hypothetical protein